MDKNKIIELVQKQNNTRNFSSIRTKSGKKIRSDIIRSNILATKKQTSLLIGNKLKTIIDVRISDEGGGSKNQTYPDTIINQMYQ